MDWFSDLKADFILNFIEKDEVYQQFLVQYYTNHVYNVDEIILPSDVGDLDAVKQYIENKHKKKLQSLNLQLIPTK